MSMGSTAPSTSSSILLFVHFALMAALCLLLLRACFSSAPLRTASSRKVLVAMENPPLARDVVEAAIGGRKNGEGSGGEMAVSESESELRRVPSGPDPLHHHGSTPRKPDNRNNVPPSP